MTATADAPTADAARLQDRGEPHRYMIALAVVLASVLQVIDTSIVNVAIPHMMGSLGATIDEIAWVSTGYILASVIVIPLTGWLAAFFGRRRYFASSILIFTASSFFCGASRSLDSLVFWRVIQGIGGGALLSTSQAIIYEAFPRDEAGKAIALWGVGVMVGPTIGPTLGGWITDNYSWPWIFYINLPIGLLSAFLVLAYVHDRAPRLRDRSVDALGILLLIVSVGCLQYMIEHGQREDWFNSRLITTLTVVGVATGLLLVWREFATRNPAIDFRVLRHRPMWVGTVIGILIGVALYGSVFVLPLFLQGLLHKTAFQTGMIILPGAIATAVSMFFVGRVSNTTDPRWLIVIGSVLFGISMWQLGHLTTQSGNEDLYLPLIYRGLGLGLVFVPLTNLALADLDRSELAQGTGLFNFFRQIGGSFGIAAIATLLTRYTDQATQVLRGHMAAYGSVGAERLTRIAHGLIARGVDPVAAHQQGLAILSGEITAQASMIAFDKIFLLSGIVLVGSMPLLGLVKKPPPRTAIVTGD